MNKLKRMGGPPAGTVSTIAVSDEPSGTLFVGTKIGLYRTAGEGKARHWQRLEQGPIGIMTLALSPHFATDRRIIAGTDTGIYLSADAGTNWHAAQIPIAPAMVLAISFSPNDSDDAMLLAGTLEDGIWHSEDGGEHWVARSFGVLDATVFALAFSPHFAQDQTIFAGTDTAVYYSYNGARAWKQLSFPEASAPVLSLVAAGRALFAGTEQHGLYRSMDGGATWQALSLSAQSINALLAHTQHGLVAATEMGVWRSQDDGESWTQSFDTPDVISLAATQDKLVAGLVDQGAWQSQRRRPWRSLSVPPSRSLSQLALSPDFERDRCAFISGLQEGLWRSRDAGKTWVSLHENLPSLDVHACALSPTFATDHTLVVALSAGLCISRDSGDHWQIVADTPSAGAPDSLAVSHAGQWLVGVFAEAGLNLSRNWGQTWVQIPGPWDVGGRIIGLAISSRQQLHVALLEGTDNTLSLWHGPLEGVGFQNDLRERSPDNPVVNFWLPNTPFDDPFGYASFGDSVWIMSKQAQTRPVRSIVVSPDQPGEHLIALTGLSDPNGVLTLYACSHKRLFVAHRQDLFKSDSHLTPWQPICDFGAESAIACSVPSRQAAYVMLLGGTLCELPLTH